jgi:hypothetical protein
VRPFVSIWRRTYSGAVSHLKDECNCCTAPVSPSASPAACAGLLVVVTGGDTRWDAPGDAGSFDLRALLFVVELASLLVVGLGRGLAEWVGEDSR